VATPHRIAPARATRRTLNFAGERSGKGNVENEKEEGDDDDGDGDDWLSIKERRTQFEPEA